MREKSPGRKDYAGEIRIPRQVAESYVAATDPCDSRGRAAPLLANQAPGGLATEKQRGLCIPRRSLPKSLALWHEPWIDCKQDLIRATDK